MCTPGCELQSHPTARSPEERLLEPRLCDVGPGGPDAGLSDLGEHSRHDGDLDSFLLRLLGLLRSSLKLNSLFKGVIVGLYVGSFTEGY